MWRPIKSLLGLGTTQVRIADIPGTHRRRDSSHQLPFDVPIILKSLEPGCGIFPRCCHNRDTVFFMLLTVICSKCSLLFRDRLIFHDRSPPMDYVIETDNKQAWRWRGKAAHHETSAVSSEGSIQQSDCRHSIDLVQQATAAPV